MSCRTLQVQYNGNSGSRPTAFVLHCCSGGSCSWFFRCSDKSRDSRGTFRVLHMSRFHTVSRDYLTSTTNVHSKLLVCTMEDFERAVVRWLKRSLHCVMPHKHMGAGSQLWVHVDGSRRWLTRWCGAKLAHDVAQPAGVVASSYRAFISTACKKFARQSQCCSIHQLGANESQCWLSALCGY